MLLNIFMLITSGLLLFWLFKPLDLSKNTVSIGYRQQQNELTSFPALQEINRLDERDELNVLIHHVNYGEAKSNV